MSVEVDSVVIRAKCPDCGKCQDITATINKGDILFIYEYRHECSCGYIITEYDNAELDEWQCPNCGWNTMDWAGKYDENPEVLLGRYFYHEWDNWMSTGASWTELWRCPDCGTIFECENGW